MAIQLAGDTPFTADLIKLKSATSRQRTLSTPPDGAIPPR
jgi:hypothetical protein